LLDRYICGQRLVCNLNNILGQRLYLGEFVDLFDVFLDFERLFGKFCS
jgi:hypothetical protein